MPPPTTHRTVVLNVVALSPSLISRALTPHLFAFFHPDQTPYPPEDICTITPPFPAVTCVSQSTYLTGKPPSLHGITANGFYEREASEIRNWHQSRGRVLSQRLFDQVKKQDPNATVFCNCWWHGMYDEAIDYMVTPRPQYHADGRKSPDCYTKPASLRPLLQGRLGKFPLHRFWGPLAGIQSSQWIASAAMMVEDMHAPTLSLIYLPHLDYVLQRQGPDDTSGALAQALRDIDRVVGELIEFYSSLDVDMVVLSEYGITQVDTPVHINRVLRKHGYIEVRDERSGETLDYGASQAFAYADHQIAHVHVRNEACVDSVRTLLEGTPGIERVIDSNSPEVWAREAFHPLRSGQLIAIANERCWFTYYFWTDDRQAPDYARTINIHEKPGYDPCEMLLTYRPFALGIAYAFSKFVMSTLLRIRVLIDATPIDEDAVRSIRGSHGRIPKDTSHHPVIGTSRKNFLKAGQRVEAKAVYTLILQHLFVEESADVAA